MTRRLNRYICQCGSSILSEDMDHGVTPFMLPCGGCGGSMLSQFYRTRPEDQNEKADIEWYSPSFSERAKMTRATREHVVLGGLVYRVVSDKPAVHHLKVLQERQWKAN